MKEYFNTSVPKERRRYDTREGRGTPSHGRHFALLDAHCIAHILLIFLQTSVLVFAFGFGLLGFGSWPGSVSLRASVSSSEKGGMMLSTS